jgi:hypothetical protein
MTNMIAYFDCSNGAAGDMIVASLIDAGADWHRFCDMMAGLKLEGYQIEIDDVKRAGLRARYFLVKLDKPGEEGHAHGHPLHRDLQSIVDIIHRAKLPGQVKERAVKVFTRLAVAEAHAHGSEISEVHFHEVGALDAIVDIVGACVALELLGIRKIYYSKVAVGGGQVKGSHGVLPVPAPATAALLEGQVIESGNREFELTTPTGAAILTTLGEQRVHMPEIALTKNGYGAGAKDDPHYPNVLRVMVGEAMEVGVSKADAVTVLTFGVDDMTGEHLGYLAERLMKKGALDVAQIPMYMKKGRPAVRVEVLAEPGKVDELTEEILKQSSTFGLRLSQHQRVKLEREFVVVILPEGKIRVKLGKLAGLVVQISPEYDDCRNAADRSDGNFGRIYARAEELARQDIEAGG